MSVKRHELVPVPEDTLHLGCGDDYKRGTHNVDVDPGVNPDTVCNLDEDWPFPDACVSRIDAHHVFEHLERPAHFFEEAGRVLVSGGVLTISVPLGDNAAMDDDHVRSWVWRSAIQYCANRQRPWDPDVPFVLESRSLNVGLRGPFRVVEPLFQVLAQKFPQWGSFRAGHGEMTAVYRRVKR